MSRLNASTPQRLNASTPQRLNDLLTQPTDRQTRPTPRFAAWLFAASMFFCSLPCNAQQWVFNNTATSCDYDVKVTWSDWPTCVCSTQQLGCPGTNYQTNTFVAAGTTVYLPVPSGQTWPCYIEVIPSGGSTLYTCNCSLERCERTLWNPTCLSNVNITIEMSCQQTDWSVIWQ